MTESDQSKSKWTLETLKEYFENRLKDMGKALDAALAAAKEAVLKAENSNDKRFEAANDVKATFSGELNKKLDRTEYDSNHKALQRQVDELKRTVFVGTGIAIALSFGIPILIQFIK